MIDKQGNAEGNYTLLALQGVERGLNQSMQPVGTFQHISDKSIPVSYSVVCYFIFFSASILFHWNVVLNFMSFCCIIKDANADWKYRLDQGSTRR